MYPCAPPYSIFQSGCLRAGAVGARVLGRRLKGVINVAPTIVLRRGVIDCHAKIEAPREGEREMCQEGDEWEGVPHGVPRTQADAE